MIVSEKTKYCSRLESKLENTERERDEAFETVTDMFVGTREAFKSRYPKQDPSFLENLMLEDD